MATNEQNQNASNQSGQQRNQEGEQNAYGQDSTNQNRDGQHLNAANQSAPGQHPNPASQQREGQQGTTGPGSQTPDPTSPNRGSGNNSDSDGMKQVDKVIPEVPLREEEHDVKTPKADAKTANREGIDRFDSNSSDQGTIDDSSKFSE